MVKIALDPAMYHVDHSVADEVRKAAELGYEYLELSPRPDWFFWHRYPKADDDAVAEVRKACGETGVSVLSLVPVFNWSSPDEQERQAQVRNWRRLLEIADGLDCRTIVSELSGAPAEPLRSEHAFYASMEELIPHFERYGIALNLEAHPYDFSERNDDAVQIIRGLNRPWVNYVFCAPHAFHLSDGVGDVRRMMEYAGGKLQHLHIADCFNHRANVGNRYIINPPGVDARIHQHNEIGNGDLDWDEFFATLARRAFDGIATVCVFGWEEDADAIHRRMLEKLTAELGGPSMTDVECVLDARAELGECPVWSAHEQALYWVDIRAPALHRLDPGIGRARTWPMPSRIGSFGLRDGGRRRGRARRRVPPAGLRHRRADVPRRAASACRAPGSTTARCRPTAGSSRARWTRSSSPARSPRCTGSIRTARLTAVVDGLIVSNGLAWSADGRTMFHSDSKAQVVWTYDYDPGTRRGRGAPGAGAAHRGAGTAGRRRDRREGLLLERGHLRGRAEPVGARRRLDRSIPLPCSNPTAPCFGGPDLRTIFVTSLRHDLPAEVLADKPLSGGIFAVRVDVPGVPVARFAG